MQNPLKLIDSQINLKKQEKFRAGLTKLITKPLS